MPATALVTSEQYLALPDEFDQFGNRIQDELIGGEIVKMPPASPLHDVVKNEIRDIIRDFLRANPQHDLKSLVEIGFRLSKYDTCVPDVSVVRRNRIDLTAKILDGAPDLAIEVVSPSETASHLKTKVEAYLTNGSQSVWIAFPEHKSVEVHRRGTTYELRGDDRIEDPLLPGFSVPVSAFFEMS
jgi:Uma2 family endonuclease